MKNFLQVNRALAAEKNFTKLGSKLQANQSQMARNLWYKRSNTTGNSVSVDSSTDGGTTLDETRGNHAVITRLSPRNHPLLHLVWKYAACITLLLTLACGNVWGSTDFTVTLDNIQVSPSRSGLVKVTKGSNTSLSSGKISVASNKTGSFTIASNISATYKIKSIAFTCSQNVTSGNFTSSQGTLSGSNKSWTFTPTSSTPVGSATFSLVNGGSANNISPIVVTLTTDETIVVEELSGFSLSTRVFSFTTSISPSTTQVNLTDVGTTTGAASSSQISYGTGDSKSFGLSVALKSGYNLKFVSIYYYDNASDPNPSASTGTYTKTTYTWLPSTTATSVVLTYAALSEGTKIRKIYVGYEAAAAKDYTVTAATSTGDNTYGTVSAAASSLDEDETTTITATPATGYQVTNWAVSGTGASISPSGASNATSTTLTMGTENATVTATFGPKSYTVTLNNQEADADGTESVTTTYYSSSNLTSAIAKPTKDGKVFAGYFTATNGGGVQLIDPAGNWITSAGGNSTYMEGSKNCKYDNDLTLYAGWMEYAESLDLQNYVETEVGSSVGDKKTSKEFTHLTSNNYICSLLGNTELDNSDNAAYRGLKFKNSGDYILFLVPANYSLSVKWGYVKSSKPKYSINGAAAQTFTTLSTDADNTSSPGAIEISSQSYIQLVKLMTSDANATVLKEVTITSAASSCTGAWSFHSKNSSSEWRDPICMELDGDGDFYISEETAINVGDVSYKVGYQGADETKTVETDWQWMPMGPARNWTVGAHPTASNAGGALGYFYIHSSYTDNNRYIGFFPSSYMLRQGSGESWSNTTFNPASSAYGETVWTTPVQKYTASNAADYMYTALGTGNGGAVGCAMSTAMRPIYLKLHSDWKASSPKFYIYYFKNGTDQKGWSGLMQAVPGTNGDDLVGWIPEGDWDRVNFVRFNPSDAVASWNGNVWNCTYAITIDNEKNYYVLDAQGSGGANDWYGHWDLYHNGFYRIWVDNNTLTNFALHYVPQYVLEYDNNGGSGSIDPQSVALDADPNTVTVKAVTGFTAPTGKHFVNWGTTTSGGTTYSAGASYSLTADATLYAQWAWNTYDVSTSLTNVTVSSGTTGTGAATHGSAYTVTLQGETGYNRPATVTVTIGGSPATLTTDYTWNSSTGVLTVLAAKVTGNISITASGVAQEYSITYKDQGDVAFSGTHADGYPTSHTYGTATTLKGATKTGYTFGGWFGNSECPGDALLSIPGTAYTANFTLYAKWTAKTYTVTLDPDNSASTVTVTATYDAAMPSKLSDGETSVAVPTFTNYVFGGYFDDHCGAGTKYYTNAVASANTWDKTSATTLYAKWTQSITLDREGATTGSTSVTATYKSATLPSITNPEKDGYTFEGWYSGDDGTGDLVISKAGVLQASVSGYTGAGGIWTSSSTRTLHAKWEEEETTYEDKIVWAKSSDHGGEGKCMSSDDANATAKDNNDKNDLGHSYVQISSTNTGMRRPANVDDVFSVTFTAKSGYYIKSICTYGKIEETDGANYSWDGGSNWTNIAKYSSQATKTFDAPSATEPTSFIIKYTCTNTGSGGIYWRNAVITLGDASASTYTVSITADPDGYGSVSSSSVTSVASGTTLSTSTNTLSVGATDVTASATSATAEYTYSFNNWTKSDGTALPSTVTADLSVYANFTRSANSYTLTWNANGGSDGACTGSCTSGSTAYGTTLVAPEDPTLSNYTFDGWNTADDGTGDAAAATMPSAATTYYAAWKQTVTLNTGSKGSGSNQTPVVYLNGSALSDATVHTATGYTLNGYYTAASGGTKVLNDDGSLVSNVSGYTSSAGKWNRTGAAVMLYAQWRAKGGASCNTIDHISDFPSSGSTGMTVGNLKVTYSGNKVSRETATIYSGKTGCNVLKIGGSGTGQYVQGYLGGNEISSLELGVEGENSKSATPYCVAFSASSTFDNESVLSWSAENSQKYTNTSSATSDTLTSITVPSGAKYFRIYRKASFNSTELGAGSSVYVWHIKACSAGASTHEISYDAGGGTGSMDDETSISDDGSQELTDNAFTAPTNFAFAGWVADVDVTIGGSTVTAGTLIADGATITNITSDIALTAVWSQTITLDDNDANHGATGDGSATVYYNATSLASISHTTAASGYKLAGYYTDATSGTKVLNSDGSFASDDVTGYIEDGKWVQNDDDEPLLYAQYEASGSIKWNLQVNSADAPIVTSSKNSSYTQISTSNMTNLDSIGLNITASKKASMTSKISAPAAFDKDKYMKVTFQVASGYQFKPSSIKVPIQPVSGGADVKLVLVDNAATPDSIGKVQSSLSKGTLTTVEMTNSSAVFKGTVTLKIYCYGSSTGTYRLGTPIQIDGEIESTCTMPSYGSVSYSQTEYVKNTSASAISVVGASGDPSYQWKYNSTGDRTSGTNCGTEASVTPSTESTGTLYYWCELTNACGTVKTPAVAITVSASKSTATVTWTDPSTPNYGGGGYTIKATVNEAWNGNASDLIITAPAGIRIYDKTSGTDGSGKKYVQVKFDVQTALDRSTYEDKIPFTVSADATATYNAISIDHNLSYSACSGGGGSATEELMAVDASHIDNSTWKGAWVYEGIGMMRYGHGSSDIAAGKDNANLTALTYKMADDDVDTYYKSSANHFGFYTEKAITGVRLYVHTSNDNVTVSGVYIGKDAFTSGTPSSGAVTYEAVYNDDNEALRSGTHSGSAWVDITFDKEVAAEKYGQINLSSNVRIAGIAFISASGSGATLTTTLAFATTGTIAKTQSAANFTNAASVTAYSETLGAITYSSSNTDCATVDSKTGEVTITASGASDQSTTITATLAASGCYKGATTTYTITVAGVSCTVNHGTLASDVTTKCSTADATLTLTGFDSGATVQWYKGESTIGNGATYAITTEGTTSTMVTKEVGTYSVMVTKDECSDRSNSITISNYSAEVAATKIVDKWYIKNGRVTPDIALWALDEGTHLSSVAWSPSNATGLTAADDFYESDGIVYLKGTEPSSNESSDVEYTLTLTVKDECENKTLLNTSAKQITLIHQKNTDKHVLAFVVTGTEKGGWTAGISADQTTGVDLYNEIAKNFDVQATNIYSTDDEQKLKEYYSQFDILCITDYPNTKTKGVNSKSYVDAIGALIDIRPILTMEAWVSGLSNWKSKGISGTPKSPTTRQYSMLLQCKDHEIFSGTNPTTVGSGDETMYRIDMVDKTQEEYVTLDATYGAGAHESDKNYQYGKKPALQGFTYDASMSSLLPIGRIDDGEGNDLEVGVERQAVMEARLLVLGINGYAMERLDDDGQTIVINALKYLMKKNAEDIADCSNYFVGGAEGDPYSWKNLDNWSGSTLPDRTQEVRIVAPCVISDTIARASSVKIVTGGTYSHGTKTANGSLIINPTGSLIVEGKIYAATAPNFFEKRTTEPENLIVKADADHTGTLIFDNEDGETQATIEMYSKSYWETVEGKYKKYWSYVGMPIKDVHIPEYFYGAFTYYYNETKGWERRFDNDIMQPFEGIGLSMQTGHKETFYGTMVSTENVDIKLTSTAGYGDGDNLIGNSWTAPIQIANFDASDFGDALATIYIFNTGREGKTYVDATEENDGAATAGQWLGVPISVAGLGGYSGLKVIPAMNAFLVYNDEGAGTTTTVHLDYDKLVRDGAASNAQINEPMRAPKQDGRRKKKDVEGLMRIRVAGENTNTDVWMMQDPRFSEAFDNGWEAYYTTCDDRSAQLYARSSTGKMSFLALPDLDGTVLGFAPSRDGNNYTFTFKYRGEDEYYLNDLKLQQSVLINADNTYAFTYEKGDTNRFYISRTPLQAPQTPTGIGNTEGTSTQSTKAIKVIYNDKLYIIRGGRVYSADGSLVK